MNLIVVSNSYEIAETATQILCKAIKDWETKRKKTFFVLGLPTGKTPLEMYSLWQLYSQEERLDFRKIITFNMDEYCDLPATHPSSYAEFMRKNLFSELKYPPAQVNLLNGCAADPVEESIRYENRIKELGGVDLFFGGIGSEGHLAFNEKFSPFASRTRKVKLGLQTRNDNASWFDNQLENVPTHALSVGLKTISEAKILVILAQGDHKASAIAAAIEGPVTHKCPASLIQMHANSWIVCDESAARLLSQNTRKHLDYVRP